MIVRRVFVGRVFPGHLARVLCALGWFRPGITHGVLALALTVALGTSDNVRARQSSAVGWPFYGADQGGTKYSPLEDLTAKNIDRLAVAWEWKPGEVPLEQFGTRPGNFQNTPLMIDNVLYVSTPYNQVAALDAETGRERWRYDPRAYADGQPPNGTGFVHRGLAAWRDGSKLRLFLNSRYRLICLDAETGKPVESFGDNGIIDISKGLVWEIEKKHYTQTSPPVVYRDLVILGNGVGDRLVYKNDPPGDIRAFDARTGKQVWSFRTIPRPGELGHDTWEQESWRFTGHTNAWAPMTLDDQRGLLYVPVGTPSNDFYGGRRPGAGLFGESIVCLDAATGARKWHYQLVQHGVWDYDPPSPPNLVTLRKGGKTIDAVVQLTKQGFAFVFDRVTGEPVWPIEHRKVPPSDLEGEALWPTQPFPTKPPAFTEQGVSLDDAFDLTPALKADAQAALKQYRLGPLYTPPSREGTVMRPGVIGGANWGGAAFDPETNRLYVKSSNAASIARVIAFDRSAKNPRASEVDAEFVGDLSASTSFVPRDAAYESREGASLALPLLKPPYGHLTAIDLNDGDLAWRVPFGDNPQLREHPALAGVTLPPRLGVAAAPGVIVTKGGLVIGGGGDTALYAFDKRNGREVWHLPLPRRVTGTPMTYRSSAGRQFIVVATSNGADASLVALALRSG